MSLHNDWKAHINSGLGNGPVTSSARELATGGGSTPTCHTRSVKDFQ
jgi:hypothetical protein